MLVSASSAPIRVTVKVPASCANLGPGLDIFALALDMYNTTTFEKSEVFEMTVEGEGQDELSSGKDNLIYTAFESVYHKIGEPAPCVKISCKNNIPVERGLGSSAAAVLTGLLAANTFSGVHLSTKQILELATLSEGHADNVTAALIGGCVLVLRQDGNLSYFQIPFPTDLKAVTFIPSFKISTREARKCLESPFALKDVLFNSERVALLVVALTTNRLDMLKTATQDRLHQPRRKKLFPQMDSIFNAALAAGALGTFLSGSGSSIIALVKDNELKIGQAMVDKGVEVGVTGRIVVLHPNFQGAQIVSDA